MVNVEIQTLNVGDYVKKIIKMESMLKDIKRGLTLFDNDFQKSIKRGKQDIAENRVTVCKTEDDLDEFFASI